MYVIASQQPQHLKAQQDKPVAVNQLIPNDVIILNSNEVIPTDGVLLTSTLLYTTH